MSIWLQLTIICPLIFGAAFIDAIAGGGGLISLPAYMFAGFPVHGAIATNKISAAFGTTISTFHYWKKGYFKIRKVLPIILFSFVGSALGAELALLINESYFKIFMLLILPPTAYYVTKEKNFDKKRVPYGRIKTFLICVLAAFTMGIYDGCYGPGTGTFLLLMLTGLAHLTISEANGVAKAINLSTNYAALGVYLLNGKADILIGLIAGIFGLAGGYFGARYFEKHGGRSVRLPMMLVLVIFIIKIIWDFVGLS